jgi:hypothetical protein
MPSKSAKSRLADLREKPSARRVAIIAFPGVTLLDISGPAQVFAELQEIELPSANYSLSYLSTSEEGAASRRYAWKTARLLLESSEIGGGVEVAQRAGFGDDERMRRAFMRQLGVPPSQCRSRFSGRAATFKALWSDPSHRVL